MLPASGSMNAEDISIQRLLRNGQRMLILVAMPMPKAYKANDNYGKVSKNTRICNGLGPPSTTGQHILTAWGHKNAASIWVKDHFEQSAITAASERKQSSRRSTCSLVLHSKKIFCELSERIRKPAECSCLLGYTSFFNRTKKDFRKHALIGKVFYTMVATPPQLRSLRQSLNSFL